MKFSSLVSALSAIGLASAANFTVKVGENGGLTYNPSSVNASVGDTIAFQFVAKNHSVTQSTFASPCNASGVNSGFFPVAANATTVPEWSFTLDNASAPLWFFCAQTGHCAKGMVFAVNPTAAKSFNAFQAAANATGANSTTAGASGSGSAASGTAASPSASVAESAVASSSGAAGTAGAASVASDAMSTLSFSSATGLLAVVGLVFGVAL
ncbi:Cupredoxin [Phellopilus nigrolimitatus]|nr:Cupredoxin [Phellopilus nigrolimitatus]